MIRKDRYHYEVAASLIEEAVLDLAPRRPSLLRAYRKLKATVVAYAYIDFLTEGVRSREEALAYAWEDAEIAFRGYGESCMTGAIVQFWSAVGSADTETTAQMRESIRLAFEAAEAATHADVKRRYLKKHRKEPIRDLSMGFDLPAILPTRGIKLREWAIESGKDVSDTEEEFFWAEEADMALQERERDRKRPKHQLKLLFGGKKDEDEEEGDGE